MYREKAAGMYDALPFAVAQCIVEVPYNFIQACIFAVISYFCMGFEGTAGAHPENRVVSSFDLALRTILSPVPVQLEAIILRFFLTV